MKDSVCKPNKIWIGKGSEFYSRSIKSRLQKNDTEIYSIHNEKWRKISGCRTIY